MVDVQLHTAFYGASALGIMVYIVTRIGIKDGFTRLHGVWVAFRSAASIHIARLAFTMIRLHIPMDSGARYAPGLVIASILKSRSC